MIDNTRKIEELHPCFGKMKSKGRIHLPVCPNCNIQCNFCDRKINDTMNYPGITRAVITPEEAITAVNKAVTLCPEITVVGIAGPGDTLASNRAIDTFSKIKNSHPHLLKCMSTNGLLLAEKAEELLQVGIDTLTVTVNGVESQIVSKIVSKIIYEGKIYTGEEAANILIRNQLKGIERMAHAGVTIKVNTVLIPEINDEHIEEIAKTVSSIGGKIHNIIPLIPRHHFADRREPTCYDLEKARKVASKHMDVFLHCMKCRADAVGILGGADYSSQVYGTSIEVEDTFSHG